MQWLAEISIKRPVFASVLVLALVVVGGFSYFTLGIDRFPRVDLPVVSVTTRLAGSAGEQIETEITDQIERAVNTISGIDELRSVSTEGSSQVFVQFVLEKDIDVAAQEVRDKVSQILADLPEDADSPVIDKIDPDAEPVLQVAVSANRPIREVSEFADKQLRRELESMPGVGEVALVGSRLRQIDLWLDPARLRSFGLTTAQVARAVSNQNEEFPGGNLEQGDRALSVRLQAKARSPFELGQLVIAEAAGVPVRLADVADVEDGEEAAETSAAVRGRPTVVLAIRKQSGTNTVAVVNALKQKLAGIQAQMPAGFALEIVRDQSEYIEASVHTVQEHLVVGGLLAALVVLLFLRNWRSTVIAAIAIPTSIVSTFALMNMLGLTLNMMTLLALTLAVGIVIDDAIVVLENIHRVMAEKGLSAIAAAREGTREIGLAVLATTLSLVAVFVPVAFMGGIVGRFMFSFGMSMAFAIMVSLFVAFTLTPMLASRWLSERDAHHEQSGRFFGALERGYERLLAFVMRRRWTVVVSCALALLSCVPLMKNVGKDFLPKNDESQFEVSVRAPEGTSLHQTELIGGRIARAVEQLPGVRYTVVLVGDDSARTANLATLFVKLAPVRERTHSQFEIMDQVREQVLPAFARSNLRTAVSPIAAIGGGGRDNKEVAFFVSGPDIHKLADYSRQLCDALRQVPGAIDIDTSLVLGKPELHVQIDRAKAAEMGVEAADIGDTLRVLVGGRKVTDYDEGGEQYEVRARAPLGARIDAADLAQMTVPSAHLPSVGLDQLVQFEETTGAGQIDRLARRRQVTITANMQQGFDQKSALDALTAAVRKLGLEPGYTAGVTGNSKEMGSAARNFAIAFLLSFVFMYLILAAQFESWIHPVTILLALPLTVPFALVSLLLLGQSLNVYTALGLLVLFGVVKKNAILQIDHTLALRAQGLSLFDATLRANKDRLRPILMTTIAFVAGMVPLLVSKGVGSGDNRAIGSVIFGGQILSLLLTLLATPVAYSLFEDVRTSFHPLQWARALAAAFTRRLPKLARSATALLLLALFVMGGCAAPAARTPEAPAPATWRDGAAEAASLADVEFGQLFDDARLHELVAQALAANKDVRIAAARVAEQRALAAAAGSARLPELTAQGSAWRNHLSTATVPGLPFGADNEGAVWSAQGRVSWDLDLWGRLRSADAAEQATLLATEWARRGVVVTLVRDVAETYFELLELDAELAIARRTLASREQSLALVEQLRAAQLGSELELERARAEVSSAGLLPPNIERRRAEAEHRLAILLGQNPGPIAHTASLAALPLPQHVPAGLPSALLARRPDIQEAALQLAAANSRSAEAWATLFPEISLTGSLGSESTELHDLFHGPASVWSYGPSVTLPLFDFGRREAQVDAATARAEQAVLRFEQTVQQAFREVEDALAQHREARGTTERQEALIGHRREALRLTETLFREQLGDQLDVLDAQRALLQAELDGARNRLDVVQAMVRLYAALGGGWMAEAVAKGEQP